MQKQETQNWYVVLEPQCFCKNKKPKMWHWIPSQATFACVTKKSKHFQDFKIMSHLYTLKQIEVQIIMGSILETMDRGTYLKGIAFPIKEGEQTLMPDFTKPHIIVPVKCNTCKHTEHEYKKMHTALLADETIEDCNLVGYNVEKATIGFARNI